MDLQITDERAAQVLEPRTNAARVCWYGIRDGAGFYYAARLFRAMRDSKITVLTMIYAYATAFGIIYAVIFFAKTGINVFQYSDLEDFLMLGLRHPIALAVPLFLLAWMFLSSVIGAIVSSAVLLMFYRLGTLFFPIETVKFYCYFMVRFLASGFSLFAMLFGIGYALFLVVEIPIASLERRDCQSELEITSKAEQAGASTPATEVAILSTTDNYLFVREGDNDEHHVIPRETLGDAKIVRVPDPSCILLQ
jgi:hypothetical protein